MTTPEREPARTVPVTELASVIRSKNASPFLSTVDMFFDRENYELVRDCGVLTPPGVAGLLRIPPEDVIGIFFHDVACGVKISFVKAGHVASGDPECTDVFGAQQYIPMLDLRIPVRCPGVSGRPLS
jgi:hypothetical protein